MWRVMIRSILACCAIAMLWLVAMPAYAVTVERVVSPSGIEAWLVQDRTNPIIAVDIAFRGGSSLDPRGKTGLGYMAAGLLDEGAGPYSSFEFQKTLEDKAIRLSFESNQDSFHGRLQSLTKHRETAFDLLRLALTAPRFDTEPVERIRSQILTQLAHESQDPDAMAAQEFYRLAYPNHPYGHPVKGFAATLKTIAVKDLKDFVKTGLTRDRLVIGVAGDITPQDLGLLLDKTFGGLPKSAHSQPAVAEIEMHNAGTTRILPQNNPQSIALFGQKGVKRSDPDYYAAYVMNYILGGGGFSSRLTEEIREKRGLAYSVSSALVTMNHSGLILGGVATENARLTQSLDLIRQEWRRMAEEGVSQKELDDAKTYLIGSFPLQLRSTEAIAGMLTALQLDKLGIDYLEKRASYIENVTLADVKRIAQNLLTPDRLTMIIVGPVEEKR